MIYFFQNPNFWKNLTLNPAMNFVHMESQSLQILLSTECQPTAHPEVRKIFVDYSSLCMKSPEVVNLKQDMLLNDRKTYIFTAFEKIVKGKKSFTDPCFLSFC